VVGNGQQYEGQEENVGSGGDQNQNTEDWRPLGFSFDFDTYDSHPSYVCYAGDHLHLRYQRHNQRWPSELLPEQYHVHPSELKPENQRQYGGLIGEISLLLALVAFSVPVEEAHSVFPHCVSQLPWQLHELDRRRGCECHMHLSTLAVVS